MRPVWPLGCALLLATPAVSAADVDASPVEEEQEEEERDPKLAEKALVGTEPEPPPPPDVAVKPREPTPYGGQILITDLVALLSLIGGAAGRSEPLIYLSLGIYALGPPIIHGAHGNPGTALGSLGLRVGVPPLAAAMGCAADTGCYGGALLGLVAGYLTVVIVDAGALAYEDPKPKAAARVMPYTAWLGHGGLLGVQGLF